MIGGRDGPCSASTLGVPSCVAQRARALPSAVDDHAKASWGRHRASYGGISTKAFVAYLAVKIGKSGRTHETQVVECLRATLGLMRCESTGALGYQDTGLEGCSGTDTR